MNFKSILGILLSASLVFSKDNECKTIEERLAKEGLIEIFNCNQDKNGKATEYDVVINDIDWEKPVGQSFFNELGSLTNAQYIQFSEQFYSKDNVDLEPLKKLEKVNSIDFTELRSYKFGKIEFPKYFKNLKILRYGRFYNPTEINNDNIEELTFRDCEYADTTVNFENLTKLKTLYIESTPDDAGELDIRLPKNIEKLTLKKYSPTKNLIKQILALSKLESLNLNLYLTDDDNDISSLKKLSKLTELSLTYYQGELIIPEFVTSFTNLKSLYLEGKISSKIIEKLSNLKNLEKLSLPNDDFSKSIIDKISNLTQLKYLDLSGNKITTISDNIAKLTKLEYLYLNNNDLSSVNEKISNLKNLKYLELSGNKFTSLPEKMVNLKNLEELQVRSCDLTEVPQFLNKLPKLKIINFAYCKDLKGKSLTNESLEE